MDKKIFLYKLVNVHKQGWLVLIMVLSSISSMQAQTWTLQQCIDTALVYNKSLQISSNNYQISEEKAKEVKAHLIPKLDVNGEYKYYAELPYQIMPLSAFGGPEGQFQRIQFGVPHNISANVQLSMPIYNGELLGNIATTKIATEMSNLKHRKTEEQVFFDVSNLYYNAQILQNQISFIDSNINNSNVLLHNMKLLQSQLMAKGTDVSKIDLQLQQLQTQRELIQSKMEQVVNSLKIVMGLPLESVIEVEKQIVFETKPAYDNSNSIDLQLAETQSHLLQSQLTAIKRSRLPSIALVGMYGTTGFGYTESPNQFLDFYPIAFGGIRLQYPLFNGMATQRKISQKQFELNNSKLQESLIKDQTALQTENAKTQKAIMQQTVQNTQQQVHLAEEIYNQTILQNKQGTANLTEVLMADNALRELQQQYLSVVVEYLKADLELRKLTGNFSVQK